MADVPEINPFATAPTVVTPEPNPFTVTPNAVTPDIMNKYFRGGPSFPVTYNVQKGKFQVTVPHATGRPGQLLACGSNAAELNQKVQERIETLRRGNDSIIARKAEANQAAAAARSAAASATALRKTASTAAAQKRTWTGWALGRGGTRKSRKASRKNRKYRKASRKNRKSRKASRKNY